jgi:hypothetical protein
MTLNNQNNLELNWRNVVEWNVQISRYQGFLNQKKSKLILKSKSILLFVESKSICCFLKVVDFIVFKR